LDDLPLGIFFGISKKYNIGHTRRFVLLSLSRTRDRVGAAEGKEKWGQTHTHGERGSASLWSQGAEPRWGSGGEAPCSRRGFCV